MMNPDFQLDPGVFFFSFLEGLVMDVGWSGAGAGTGAGAGAGVGPSAGL